MGTDIQFPHTSTYKLLITTPHCSRMLQTYTECCILLRCPIDCSRLEADVKIIGMSVS